MSAPRIAALLAIGLILTGCIGKIQLAVERELQPTALLQSAQLTETVRFRFEPPPGASAVPGVDASTIGANVPASGGWTVTNSSQGSTTEMRATRTLSGQQLFEPRDEPGLGRVAVRVTDLFAVRRYEVKVAVPGAATPASDASSDALSAVFEQMLLGAITYEQVLQMPGLVTSHDFPKAEGSRLSWQVDLKDPKGRVFRAESVHVDPAASAILGVPLIALLAAGLMLVRRRRTSPG